MLTRVLPIIFLLATLLIPTSLYLARFLVPDISFDAVNYHLLLGHRSFLQLTGNFEQVSREFVPTGIQNFSGFIDLPAYLTYELLGYRLSTLHSLLAVLSIMLVGWKCIDWRADRPAFARLVLGLSFLNMLFVHEALFQIGSNMVDNLAGLLVFVSVISFVFLDLRRMRNVVISGGLFGIAILAKFTNLFLVVGVLPFFAGSIMLLGSMTVRQRLLRIGVFGLLCAAPFTGWMINQYTKTANPVFPYYNDLFLSPYFSTDRFRDTRFGSQTIIETIFWPVLGQLQPSRLGETHGWFTDHRLPVYYALIGLMVLLQPRLDRRRLLLIGGVGISTLTWSNFSGYTRYAVGLEFLLGFTVVYLVSRADFRLESVIKKGVFLLVCGLLGLHLLLGRRLLIRNTWFDLSWRPSIRADLALHQAQIPFFFERILEFVDESGTKSPADLAEQVRGQEVAPDVYLNCGLPSGSLSVISEYRELPVLIVNQDSYSGFSKSCDFMNKAIQRGRLDTLGDELRFVTMYIDHHHQVNNLDCHRAIAAVGAIVEATRSGTMLGSHSAKVIELTGRLPLESLRTSACGE